MRCSCQNCGTYMVQSEDLTLGCICPQCGARCTACLGQTACSRPSRFVACRQSSFLRRRKRRKSADTALFFIWQNARPPQREKCTLANCRAKPNILLKFLFTLLRYYASIIFVLRIHPKQFGEE